jgi:glucoamylase
MFFAEHEGATLALASSAPWKKMSVGFVGASDGWQDLSQHFQMEWEYTRAENGNVACTGEIDLAACNGEFLLALGFGRNLERGGTARAIDALLEDYDGDLATLRLALEKLANQSAEARRTAARARFVSHLDLDVLRTHESKDFLGGIIASLSIPWGFNKGDEDLGGYHLVWPRDLVETAGALLAAGAVTDAVRVLRYLETTQEAAGNWAQNLWLDGRPYWMRHSDGRNRVPHPAARPAAPRGARVSGQELERWWPMVRNAVSFILRNGPVTQQDRWEEDAGYSPFTLAAEISALLAAADIADLTGHSEQAPTMRDTADAWNDNIERWVYATGGELAQQLGIDGYYVRIAPPDSDTDGAASPTQGFVPIKNRPPGQDGGQDGDRAYHIISPDALALVRFGLRAPDDPRILNTLRAIDALLSVELPQGPCWYRYNGDGYGEHKDGSAFDGTGIGRAWPLLAGERAHYALAGGHRDEAEALLTVMENSTAGHSRLLPEQVWDSADIPALELFRGKPTGSACPLVWAHSEYIKLRRSIHDNKIFDQPPQTVKRYLIDKHVRQIFGWRFNNKTRSVPHNKTLRIVLLTPARVHWSVDGWQTSHDADTRDTGLGIFTLDLPTAALPGGTQVVFTFFWPQENRWEGTDYAVTIEIG